MQFFGQKAVLQNAVYSPSLKYSNIGFCSWITRIVWDVCISIFRRFWLYTFFVVYNSYNYNWFIYFIFPWLLTRSLVFIIFHYYILGYTHNGLCIVRLHPMSIVLVSLLVNMLPVLVLLDFFFFYNCLIGQESFIISCLWKQNFRWQLSQYQEF